MALTADSSSRRKPRAASGLRAAYQSRASWASTTASRCHLKSFEATEQALADLRPGHGLDGPCFERLYPAANLLRPSRFGFWVGWPFQTLDKRTRDGCPICFVERKCLL